MKAQKEAEKPFWWELLHPEVKDKTIEEIEKGLLEGHTLPDKLAGMSKHEKYLAASEGFYAVQTKDTESLRTELETLKQESKTGFLNQPAVATPVVEESFEPIVFGQKQAQATAPISETSNFNGLNQSPSSMDMPSQMQTAPMASNGLDMPEPASSMSMPEPNSPFNAAVSSPSNQQNGAEVRKYAQSIVLKTVNDINSKATQIPQDLSITESELLSAVVEELQAAQTQTKNRL